MTAEVVRRYLGDNAIEFDEISDGVEADVARAREAPEAYKREQLQ